MQTVKLIEKHSYHPHSGVALTEYVLPTGYTYCYKSDKAFAVEHPITGMTKKCATDTPFQVVLYRGKSYKGWEESPESVDRVFTFASQEEAEVCYQDTLKPEMAELFFE